MSQEPVTLPPSISRAVNLMVAQRDKGIKKYGKPVEDAHEISIGGWLRHLQEEIADAAVYAAQLDAKLGIFNAGLRQLQDLIDTRNTEALQLCRDLQVLLTAQAVPNPAQAELLPAEKPKRARTRSRRNG